MEIDSKLVFLDEPTSGLRSVLPSPDLGSN